MQSSVSVCVCSDVSVTRTMCTLVAEGLQVCRSALCVYVYKKSITSYMLGLWLCAST